MRTCAGCGTVNALDVRGHCAMCRARRNDAFGHVRSYLYSHAGATVTDIARATGVREAEVIDLLRDGRLRGREHVESLDLCSCGQPALDGLDGRCSACSRRLAERLAKLPPEVRDELRAWRAT